MFTNMNPLDKSTALLEILIMLAGAFILGYLFCRCISKCWAKKGAVAKVAAPVAAAAAVAKAAPKASTRDDLKIIEGIGPKVEELLNAKGIYTFAQVAEMSQEEIDAFLEGAGPRFAIRKGDAWAEQAVLARDGKFDDLEALRGVLVDGKHV